MTVRDLLALAGAIPDHGLALAAAADGTTNALALASAELFAPLYGPGSAARFAALAPSRMLDVPNLIDDVDTVDDLKRLRTRLGADPRGTRLVADWCRRVNVTVLSGGVGGARFLRGVVAVVDPDNVAIVGNVADDIEILGLHVSPDLDSVLYALAGVADEGRGWGRADESWRALETAGELGGEDWFRLGDRDIGLHLVRTQLLRQGVSLSEATSRLVAAFGLRCSLLPATNDPLRTFLETPEGTFPFKRGSWSEATATKSMPCTTPARPTRGPLRAWSRRSSAQT